MRAINSRSAQNTKLVALLKSRVQFVRDQLSAGRVPNGPQLAEFVRKLRDEAWPLAHQAGDRAVDVVRSGLAQMGWDAQTNRATSSSPPTADSVLRFLETTVRELGGQLPAQPASAQQYQQQQQQQPQQYRQQQQQQQQQQPQRSGGQVDGNELQRLQQCLTSKVQFVQQKIATGRIPTPPQMAAFLRQYVLEVGPLSQTMQQQQQAAFLGLRSIGWDAQRNTNIPGTQAPQVHALLQMLKATAAQIGASLPAPVPFQQVAQPQQYQQTAAASGAAPYSTENSDFNMDEYTTKLDTSQFTHEQQRQAELLARQIMQEASSGRGGGGAGDWGTNAGVDLSGGDW